MSDIKLHFDQYHAQKLNNTHVDGNAVAVEDGCLGVVGGEVPVELVAVAVPLDGVQLVALHVGQVN